MPFEPTERVPLGRTGLRVTRLGLRRRVDRRPVRAGRRRRTPIATVEPRLGPRRSATSTRRRCTATAPSERRMGAALARPAARRVRPVDEGRPARPAGRRDPRRRRRRPPGARRPATTRSTPAPAGPDRLRLQRRRRPPLDRGEPRAARPRPDRHRAHPRPGRPLGRPRSTRRYPALAPAARGGRHPGDRRRDEPVGDARPVRPRGRLRRRSCSPAATRSSTRRRSTSCCPLCVERGIAVLVGGVMNSGILADPRPGGRFDYAAGAARRSSSGPGGWRRSAPATASRSRPRPSSSRWPIRRSPRSSPACAGSTTSTSTRR